MADRIAQTVVALWLEPRTESIFHDDSYGYRPRRGVLMVTLIGSGRPASGVGMRLAGLWGFGGVGEGSELASTSAMLRPLAGPWPVVG